MEQVRRSIKLAIRVIELWDGYVNYWYSTTSKELISIDHLKLKKWEDFSPAVALTILTFIYLKDKRSFIMAIGFSVT